LQRADATVLPSLVDNLPNTAIESLMLGGASYRHSRQQISVICGKMKTLIRTC
jgi:hypothetical protein